MRISDWSSDVCSSDLHADAVRIVDIQQRVLRLRGQSQFAQRGDVAVHAEDTIGGQQRGAVRIAAQLAQRTVGIGVRVATQAAAGQARGVDQAGVVEAVLHAQVVVAEQRLDHGEVGQERSEEHTSELQSLMRISYAVFRLKKKK